MSSPQSASSDVNTGAAEADTAGPDVSAEPEQGAGSGADLSQGNEQDAEDQPSEPTATSPRLQHLEETIDKARNAADDALRAQGS